MLLNPFAHLLECGLGLFDGADPAGGSVQASAQVGENPALQVSRRDSGNGCPVGEWNALKHSYFSLDMILAWRQLGQLRSRARGRLKARSRGDCVVNRDGRGAIIEDIMDECPVYSRLSQVSSARTSS